MNSQNWGVAIYDATSDTVEAMKAARIGPNQGAPILAEIFATVITQIDVHLRSPGFRQLVIAKLAENDRNRLDALLGRKT